MRGHSIKASTKGSIIVEAAIFIPVFIIAILTIAFTIKVFYVHEYYQHRLSEEMSLIATEAYVINQSHRIYSMGDEVTIERYRYLFNGNDGVAEEYKINSSNLIEVIASYSVHNPLAMRMISDYNLMQRITVRAWTGKEKNKDAATFEEMMEDERVVYIFPKAGTKYHKSTCRLIVNVPVQGLLTSTIKDKYKPCKLCNAAKIPIGGYVYIFNDKVFHSKECPLVSKKVQMITLSEAEKKGYEPCKICH